MLSPSRPSLPPNPNVMRGSARPSTKPLPSCRPTWACAFDFRENHDHHCRRHGLLHRGRLDAYAGGGHGGGGRRTAPPQQGSQCRSMRSSNATTTGSSGSRRCRAAASKRTASQSRRDPHSCARNQQVPTRAPGLGSGSATWLSRRSENISQVNGCLGGEALSGSRLGT